ncbi:MAG: hypothetical protein ACPGVZ_18125 [Myxococcota bacterium]
MNPRIERRKLFTPLSEQITATVHTDLVSLEKRDLEGLMALFADDCWIEDPVGRFVGGREGVDRRAEVGEIEEGGLAR